MSKPDPEKLVSFILQSILGDSGKFKIEKTEEDNLLNLEISVPKEDIGKIVGRQGSTIWAIRRLAGIAGTVLGKKVLVSLAE